MPKPLTPVTTADPASEQGPSAAKQLAPKSVLVTPKRAAAQTVQVVGAGFGAHPGT